MSDDELLCCYVRDRSEAAFRELVARHLNLVYSAALRQTKGQAHLAQDVSQLAFAALARKAPLIVGHPSLRGWLFLCTRHLAAKTLRAESRRVARETTAYAMNEPASNTASSWDDIKPVLDEVLSRLNGQDREAIFLRYFDNLSFAELGARQGVSEDTARRRLERGLERVRRLLAQRDVTSTATALGAVLTTEAVKAAPPELFGRLAQAALGGAGAAPSGVIATIALMKSMAVSSTFIAALAVAGFLAGGAGLYLSRKLAGEKAAETASTQAVADAEARLGRIKQWLAQSGAASVRRGIAPTPTTATSATLSLEEQVARDLELNRWKEQQQLAGSILKSWPFLKQHGVTAQQMEQLKALAEKYMAEAGDLGEIAKLSGVPIRSDSDLLEQAQQIQAEYRAGATGILGSDTESALNAYMSGEQSPKQNWLQTGEASWVADQVAGTAFGDGTPMTNGQKAQMTQLLLKYTPSYQPGEPNGPTTLNWDSIISEAQQTAVPPSEVAALQSFHAVAVTWAIKDQAAQAAGGQTH